MAGRKNWFSQIGSAQVITQLLFYLKCLSAIVSVSYFLYLFGSLLQNNLDKVVCGRKEVRFFFPLCGKAVDMKWYEV